MAHQSQQERENHWRSLWSRKDADEVSWYQATPSASLRLLRKAGIGRGDRVVDIGGGASKLARFLLALEAKPTVADIAPEALEQARQEMGEQAALVEWLVADVTQNPPQGPFEAWHDRAVFHFLHTDAERQAYAQAMTAAVKPGGFAVVATFSLDGPETCSGLPVHRYSAEALAAAMGPSWRLVEQQQELHRTPWGSPQSFTYILLERLDA